MIFSANLFNILSLFLSLLQKNTHYIVNHISFLAWKYVYDFVVEGGSLPVSVIQEESDPAELYYSLLFECPTTCNGKGFSICHERPFEILLLKYLVVQLLQLVVIHRFYLNERLLLCMHCCMHGLINIQIKCTKKPSGILF